MTTLIVADLDRWEMVMAPWSAKQRRLDGRGEIDVTWRFSARLHQGRVPETRGLRGFGIVPTTTILLAGVKRLTATVEAAFST